MKRSHILLFGANAFGIGLLTPVLSLALLSHGATMETLPLCIGVFAVTVVLLELPSGILADMIGRKRIFLVSAVSMTATYILLLSSRSFITLAAACALQGIGRAFSSGSIEALEIEAYLDSHGGQNLESINSTMAVIESVGLAAGSVTGGVLGFLDGSYGLLLLVAALLQVSILIMTVCFVKEPKREKPAASPLCQFQEQVRGMVASLKHSRSVAAIVLMTAALGILLCTVEVYWQPALRAFLPEHLGWIFGLITCLGYTGVSIGSKLTECAVRNRGKRLSDQATWRFYWVLRLLLVPCVAALGFTHSLWLFLAIYISVYAILGAGNLIENTFFHTAVDNGQRAGMMSLLSLSSRAGGLGASLLGGLTAVGLPFSLVWLLLPAAAAILTIGVMAFFYRPGSQRLTSQILPPA